MVELVTYYLLPITYVLLITYYLLPVTYYLLILMVELVPMVRRSPAQWSSFSGGDIQG